MKIFSSRLVQRYTASASLQLLADPVSVGLPACRGTVGSGRSALLYSHQPAPAPWRAAGLTGAASPVSRSLEPWDQSSAGSMPSRSCQTTRLLLGDRACAPSPGLPGLPASPLAAPPVKGGRAPTRCAATCPLSPGLPNVRVLRPGRDAGLAAGLAGGDGRWGLEAKGADCELPAGSRSARNAPCHVNDLQSSGVNGKSGLSGWTPGRRLCLRRHLHQLTRGCGASRPA
jgi:hypothetical protein